MNRREKQVAALVGALVGVAVLNKVVDKEARALGMSALTVAVLGWVVAQAV